MQADGRGRSQCLTPAPRRQRGPGPRSHHLDDAPLHGGDRGSPGGAAALRGGGHVWSWKGSKWGGRPDCRCQGGCRRWREVAATRSRRATGYRRRAGCKRQAHTEQRRDWEQKRRRDLRRRHTFYSRASVPERHRPPANQRPEPAGPQANRHSAYEAPPPGPKTGGALQEALKELICRDGQSTGRNFRESLSRWCREV